MTWASKIQAKTEIEHTVGSADSLPVNMSKAKHSLILLFIQRNNSIAITAHDAAKIACILIENTDVLFSNL